MRLFVRNAFPDSSGGKVAVYSHRDLFGRKKIDQVSVRRFINQWHSFLNDAGKPALHQAAGGSLLEGNYSDAAIHMMGAQLGKGLGKNLQGSVSNRLWQGARPPERGLEKAEP